MSDDTFDSNGLTVKTLTDIVNDLTTGLQNIYGSDINVDSNSPDGQLVNIIAQSCVDIRELIVQINSGFDPDQAVGSTLDQRVAINNIARAGGTFTIVPIDIIVSQTVTLQGLDGDFNNVNGTGYTIQDNSGNQFILITTATLTVGTHTVNFRAQTIGQVEVTINTLVNPVTVVLGVTSVNNPSDPISVGQNQETDAQLRIRRANSTENGNSGYLNGLEGTVLGLTGVVSAQLYENVTSSTDANGIPAHGMWLIVEGGSSTDIANAIYTKKSYGADMKGATTQDITTASGGTFTAKWDVPTAELLYIKFNIQKTVTSPSLDATAIKNYMAANLSYTIGQFADTSSLTALAVQAIAATGSGGVPTDMQISVDGTTWVDYLTTTALNYQWAVSAARITPTILS